jgi:hypothetical protein
VSGAARGMFADEVCSAPQQVADFVPLGAVWSRTAMFGTTVLMAHRIDQTEAARRRRDGLDLLGSLDELELLMSLPIGWQVPVSSLSHRDQTVLPRLPEGAVAVVDGQVVRLAVSPVRVDLAIVPAARWQTGLERAGKFAPFTARVMWLPRVPNDVEAMVAESMQFGVGVAVGSGASAEVLVPPAPFVRRRYTAAGWLFTEEAYALVR